MNPIGNNLSIYPHDYEAMESEQHPAPSSSISPEQPTPPLPHSRHRGARAAVAAPPRVPTTLPLRGGALGKRPRDGGAAIVPRSAPSLRQNLTLEEGDADQPGTGIILRDGRYQSPERAIYAPGGADLKLKDGAVLWHTDDNKRGILSEDVKEGGNSGFDFEGKPGAHMPIDRRKGISRLVHPQEGFPSLKKAGKALGNEHLFLYMRRNFKDKPAAGAAQTNPGTFQLDGRYASPKGTIYERVDGDLALKDGTPLYLSEHKNRFILDEDAQAGNSGVTLREKPGVRMKPGRRSAIGRLVDPKKGFKNLKKASIAVEEEDYFFQNLRASLKNASQPTQTAKPQAEGGEPRQGKTRQRRALPQLDAGRRREDLSPALAQAHMHSPMDPETLLQPVRDSQATGEVEAAEAFSQPEAMSSSSGEDFWEEDAPSHTEQGMAGDILNMHGMGLDPQAIADHIADDLDFALDPALVQATIEVNQAPAPATAAESSAAGQARGATEAPSLDELVRRHRAEVLIRIDDDLTDRQIQVHIPDLPREAIERIRNEREEERSMIW